MWDIARLEFFYVVARDIDAVIREAPEENADVALSDGNQIVFVAHTPVALPQEPFDEAGDGLWLAGVDSVLRDLIIPSVRRGGRQGDNARLTVDRFGAALERRIFRLSRIGVFLHLGDESRVDTLLNRP